MSRRDDPIFDPWAIGGSDEPVAPAPESAASQPAEDAGATPIGVDSVSPRRWIVPLAKLPARKPAPPAVPPAGAEADDASGPDASIVREPRAVPRAPHVRALQSVALPRLEALRSRLELAGHDVVLDDRTDRDAPSLRFRLAPRPGPFDEAPESSGTVLEVAWDEEAGHVSARLWLDPLAEEWTDEVAAPTSRVDVLWVDRVILEFVGKSLRP